MFQSLGNLLNKNIKRSGISHHVENAMVLETFTKVLLEVMGPKISAQVKPTYIRNRVLTIACMSSVLAQEVRFKEKKIVTEINKKLQKNVVIKLNYMV